MTCYWRNKISASLIVGGVDTVTWIVFISHRIILNFYCKLTSKRKLYLSFSEDTKNLTHIYNDHANTDMQKDEFKKLCEKAWQEPFGFVVIDLTSKANAGMYRCGFDTFYFLQNTTP